jgi:hypothetical protein
MHRSPEIRVRAIAGPSNQPPVILAVQARDSMATGFCGNEEPAHWQVGMAGDQGRLHLGVEQKSPSDWLVSWKRMKLDLVGSNFPKRVQVITDDGSFSEEVPLPGDAWPLGRAVEVTSPFRPTGGIAGIVVTADGSPASGVRVLATRDAIDGFLSVVRAESTRVDGTFQFDGVGVGHYALKLAEMDVEGDIWRYAEVRTGQRETVDGYRLKQK